MQHRWSAMPVIRGECGRKNTLPLVVCLVLAAALLSACGGGYSSSGSARGGYSSLGARGDSGSASPGARFVVKKGDTLYGISRRYGLSARALISTNRLTSPYILHPGQTLRIPAPNYHVVKAGETSYGIARRYGVDLSELMRTNRIGKPYTLKIGQRLKLPAQVRAPEPGSTLASVARGGTRAKQTAAPRRALANPPPRAGQRFAWPILGPVISSFGPKKGGLHNDGINIRARRDTAVRAAENGVVAYAGRHLASYGNLLLLRHSGGWVTAYAHNDRLVAVRGQQVSRGQIIAYVGTSGSITTPQLHFEIRKGARALDPLKYLSPRTALLNNEK